MKPHVRAQTLARFRQGDLSPRRSSRIGAHLARCARCQALSEDLAGVTRLLASVHPPPIPEHLEARIHTALTTEAARRVKLPEETAATTPQAEPAGTGPIANGGHPRHERPGHGRPPRAPRPRSAIALRTLAAAAVVVLVAGGIYEIAHTSSSSSSSPSASSPAAAPAVPGAAGPEAGSARSATGPALTYRHAGGEASITPVMTGTDFAPGDLSVQVTGQLGRHGRGTTVAGPNATTPSVTEGPAATGRPAATFGPMTVADLAGCVNRIAAGDLVLLVDVARYQGGPATVIVTEPSAGGPEQIWVVGPGCSASRSDVLKHAALSPAS
jgi:hypothetical protein